MGPVKSSDKKSCQPELTANDYKEQGNRYFTLRKYNEAITCYNKALVSYHLPITVLTRFRAVSHHA